MTRFTAAEITRDQREFLSQFMKHAGKRAEKVGEIQNILREESEMRGADLEDFLREHMAKWLFDLDTRIFEHCRKSDDHRITMTELETLQLRFWEQVDSELHAQAEATKRLL